LAHRDYLLAYSFSSAAIANVNPKTGLYLGIWLVGADGIEPPTAGV